MGRAAAYRRASSRVGYTRVAGRPLAVGVNRGGARRYPLSSLDFDPVVSIAADDASEYANELRAAFSPKLAQIVDVNLPHDTHDRFKTFFDDLDLAGVHPIPAWVMSL